MYLHRSAACALILSFTALLSVSVYPQRSARRTVAPTRVVWSPAAVEKRDLYYGAGGRAMRPSTSRVRFIKKETGGNNLKYRIRDARGRIWVAKIADESQPEVAANRLLWAVGYYTEIDYLAPQLTIPRKGTYRNVRLEARPAGVQRGTRWSWEQNPFFGTKEFAGLRVMMALINNWDLKDDNNVILQVGRQRRYIVSDLGSSFGKLPVASAPILNRFGRSVNDPEDYINSTFIHGYNDDGTIDFAYKAKGKKILEGITVDQARFIAGQLSRLSDKQIRDAFRAANYSPSQVNLYARAVRNRIDTLVAMTRNTEAVKY
jgi:hypothetical protein